MIGREGHPGRTLGKATTSSNFKPPIDKQMLKGPQNPDAWIVQEESYSIEQSVVEQAEMVKEYENVLLHDIEELKDTAMLPRPTQRAINKDSQINLDVLI